MIVIIALHYLGKHSQATTRPSFSARSIIKRPVLCTIEPAELWPGDPERHLSRLVYLV